MVGKSRGPTASVCADTVLQVYRRLYPTMETSEVKTEKGHDSKGHNSDGCNCETESFFQPAKVVLVPIRPEENGSKVL